MISGVYREDGNIPLLDLWFKIAMVMSETLHVREFDMIDAY